MVGASAPREDGPDARTCERLRKLVRDCISKHMNKGAIFFAGKLCSMSKYRPEDVYLLAQAFFVNKEFRRALTLLNKQELFDVSIRFRYMTALCLAECQEWEECLSIIGADDTEVTKKCKEERCQDVEGTVVNMYSAVCLLRGRIYDALENRTRAIEWYTNALKADPFCFEAYEALMWNHMLTGEQERELLDSIQIQEEDSWLRLLYSTMCKKYDKQDQVERNLDILEGKDPEASRQKKPLQPSLRQNETIPPPDDTSGHTKTSGPSDSCPPLSVTPIDTPVKVQAPNGSEENDPRGAAIPMDTSPDGPDSSRRANEAAAAARLGCLSADPGVRAARAELLLGKGDTLAAFRICADAMRRESLCTECMDVYLACLVELGKRNQLFQLGHRLVQDYPNSGIAWYAVGCYYYATAQFDAARRYFGKATQLSARHAPSWIAYGHAFAAQDESDQALAAYRTAARLFPGLHQPVLGMGREYQHMNNYMLAEQMYLQANSICKQDPLVCNELGVLFYLKKEYRQSLAWLRRALDILTIDRVSASWAPTIVNLGHVYRKLSMFDDAVATYEKALGLMPNDPCTLSALGFTHHMTGRLNQAIEMYHKALAFKADCGFTTTLLATALKEHCEFCCQNDDPGLM